MHTPPFDSILPLLLFLLLPVTTTSTPLYITSLTSRQPPGLGSTNFWSLELILESPPLNSLSAYCWSYWADNSPWSTNTSSDFVPAGEWIQCFESEAAMRETWIPNSTVGFMLEEGFTIGGVGLSVRVESTTGGRSLMGSTFFSNATDVMECDIDPANDPDMGLHMSGKCEIAAKAIPWVVDVS